MNENQGSPTAVSATEVALAEADRSVRPALPPRPQPAARPSRWTAGRITALVVGTLLGLVSLVLVGAGGTVVWADITQRDGSYLTTDARAFSTAGSALVTEPTDLGSPGIGWLYSPYMLGEVRIRVAPMSLDTTLFVGIGRTSDVDRYLAGVSHTLISDFWTETVQPIDGDGSASPPANQDFWVASDTGQGPRTLTWDATGGSWTVVVMRADGRPGVDMSADLGATMPKLIGIGIGILIVGFVFSTGAILLIVGAVRRRPRQVTSR